MGEKKVMQPPPVLPKPDGRTKTAKMPICHNVERYSPPKERPQRLTRDSGDIVPASKKSG